MHPFLLHNGEIHDTRERLLSPGQVGFLNGWGIFSTLRVSKGVLFAYERHYARMQRDSVRMRVPLPYSPEELLELLQKLIEANQASDATLRVSIIRNTGGTFEAPDQTRATDLVAFTSGLRSWGDSVRLAYEPHGRYGASRFAGAKITSWAQNLTLYEEAHERGFDEVILLNEWGQISECTSANIFLLRDGRVLTPPLGTSGCLAGVTRAVLLEEMEVPGFSFHEQELTPSELEAADQVFLTSTTRDLLPVVEVEGAVLRQDPESLSVLQAAFRQYQEGYCASPPYRKRLLHA